MLRLLVALDFSDCSRLALHSAIDIAQHAPAELTVLTVLESLSDDEASEDRALGEAERACSALHDMVAADLADRPATLRPSFQVHYTATRGTPADEIIAQALAHHADAIVLGSHGRTGLNRLLAGSVAEKVVRNAPCSVLTVKPKKTG
jgi:universal stress protein A